MSGTRGGRERQAARAAGVSHEEWAARQAAGLKRCTRCRLWLDSGSFTIDRSRWDSLAPRCRACSTIASAACRYRIPFAEMRKTMERSGGRCELCQRIPEKLVVDHCHDTNRVRGILCSACNVGMGLFGDRPEMLRRAALYLEGQING